MHLRHANEKKEIFTYFQVTIVTQKQSLNIFFNNETNSYFVTYWLLSRPSLSVTSSWTFNCICHSIYCSLWSFTFLQGFWTWWWNINLPVSYPCGLNFESQPGYALSLLNDEACRKIAGKEIVLKSATTVFFSVLLNSPYIRKLL